MTKVTSTQRTAKHNNASDPRSWVADSDRKAIWQVFHESYRLGYVRRSQTTDQGGPSRSHGL